MAFRLLVSPYTRISHNIIIIDWMSPLRTRVAVGKEYKHIKDEWGIIPTKILAEMGKSTVLSDVDKGQIVIAQRQRTIFP